MTLPLQKTFNTYIILNWKKGTFRCVKKKPKSFKASEIPIDFSLKVTIPQPPSLKASGEIKLSEHKVSEIIAEEL
jgi:hypothetical protein